MTPTKSGGKLRAARTWTASRMIAFIVVLLTPQQQGDESDEYVQQVSLDAPALEYAKPRKQPRAETKRRHHGVVEHRVRNLAVKLSLLWEQLHVIGRFDLRT